MTAGGRKTGIEQNPSVSQSFRVRAPHLELTEDELTQTTATQGPEVVEPLSTGPWYGPTPRTGPPAIMQGGLTSQPVLVMGTKSTTAQDGSAIIPKRYRSSIRSRQHDSGYRHFDKL